jgi:hypothetical protein
MAWTFEMRFPGESLWRMSAKRADTIQEAADFMAAWLVICCENALMVEVRLTQLFEIGAADDKRSLG